jgi:hypothetical protein
VANLDLFLFVSHVAENRDSAVEIVDELERRGTRCWIAPRDVRPGESFDDQIAEAIETSRAMLLIFSDLCNDSEYIRREVTVAGESQKTIIPFRIEDVRPRKGLRVRLSDLHWIDGFVSRERAIDEVIKKFAPTKNEPAAPPSGDDGEQIHKVEPEPAKPADTGTKAPHVAKAGMEAANQTTAQTKPPPTESDDSARQAADAEAERQRLKRDGDAKLEAEAKALQGMHARRWGIPPIVRLPGSVVSEPIQISFTVAARSADVRNEIVRALVAKGGGIKVDDGSKILAELGSKVKFQLLAGLAANSVPRDVFVQMKEISGQTQVSIVVLESFLLGAPLGMAKKFQKLMHDDALSLKKLFPGATD